MREIHSEQGREGGREGKRQRANELHVCSRVEIFAELCVRMNYGTYAPKKTPVAV